MTEPRTVIQIRVSPQEKRVIQARAEAANVTVSELLRRSALGASDLAIGADAAARRSAIRA